MYVRRRAAEIIFDYGRVYGRYTQIDVLFLSRCVTVSSFFLVFFLLAVPGIGSLVLLSLMPIYCCLAYFVVICVDTII